MATEQVTFLLVEDDEIDMKSLKRAFKEMKIANPIIEARDGLEALESRLCTLQRNKRVIDSKA